MNAWIKFLNDVLEKEQIERLKEAVQQGSKTLYFFGDGMGKSTLAKILSNLGITVVGCVTTMATHNHCLNDTLRFQAIKFEKKKPVDLIPGMHEMLLEHMDAIKVWAKADKSNIDTIFEKSNRSLKETKTTDLISELEKRSGVKKISVGLYKEYGLVKKYSEDPHRSIEADVVLVIDHLDET